MTIFSFIMLIGGLAFFLYGMHVMSSGLERMAGGQLEVALKKMTSNRFMGLLLGAGITIAIQSSSAVTVMLVGLVNSGIMEITQTVGVIMGSNIGTTLTAWITSLSALQTNNVWMKLLKPENFSLIFAMIGVLMIMGGKSAKKRDIGGIFVGFAVLMYGMKLMGDSMEPLQTMPEFTSMLTAFNNPLLGVLVGALFTGIIQSSAASVAILQTLSSTGAITFGMAFPIIMGQNIGTCVTALISAIGVNRNARKVSVIHIAFNIIGTAGFLLVYLFFGHLFLAHLLESSINAYQISLCHTVFNVATTALLLPFHRLLVKIANLVCDRKHEEEEEAPISTQTNDIQLDERLLATPSVAISECNAITNQMADLSLQTLQAALTLLKNFDPTVARQVIENEDLLDRYEDRMGTYLVQVSSKKISEKDTQRVSKMLHAIGDFERLGDHALKIHDAAKELKEKNLRFSGAAQKELEVLTNAIDEIITLTTSAYITNDSVAATHIEPLEQVIDGLVTTIRAKHIQRLQLGECSIELGFILTDLLGHYERISDHCSNVAVLLIELPHNTYDTHKYLNGVKYGNSAFDEEFDHFREKYTLVS